MKNNQAGGIVSFVIVGLVLVGLLGGGLYLSKLQGREARNNDTSTPQVAAPAQTNENTQDDRPASEQQTDQPAPAPSAPSGNNNSPQPAPNQANRPSQPSTNQVATTGPSESLPSTGPAETFVTLLVLSVLSFTSYKLVQSRRDLHRSALRR